MKIGTNSTVQTRKGSVQDGTLPITGPKRVRVIVLSPLTEIADDLGEIEWLRVSLTNPAFEYLRDPEEDIYTINDGQPFDET